MWLYTTVCPNVPVELWLLRPSSPHFGFVREEVWYCQEHGILGPERLEFQATLKGKGTDPWVHRSIFCPLPGQTW